MPAPTEAKTIWSPDLISCPSSFPFRIKSNMVGTVATELHKYQKYNIY